MPWPKKLEDKEYRTLLGTEGLVGGFLALQDTRKKHWNDFVEMLHAGPSRRRVGTKEDGKAFTHAKDRDLHPVDSDCEAIYRKRLQAECQYAMKQLTDGKFILTKEYAEVLPLMVRDAVRSGWIERTSLAEKLESGDFWMTPKYAGAFAFEPEPLVKAAAVCLFGPHFFTQFTFAQSCADAFGVVFGFRNATVADPASVAVNFVHALFLHEDAVHEGGFSGSLVVDVAFAAASMRSDNELATAVVAEISREVERRRRVSELWAEGLALSTRAEVVARTEGLFGRRPFEAFQAAAERVVDASGMVNESAKRRALARIHRDDEAATQFSPDSMPFDAFFKTFVEMSGADVSDRHERLATCFMVSGTAACSGDFDVATSFLRVAKLRRTCKADNNKRSLLKAVASKFPKVPLFAALSEVCDLPEVSTRAEVEAVLGKHKIRGMQTRPEIIKSREESRAERELFDIEVEECRLRHPLVEAAFDVAVCDAQLEKTDKKSPDLKTLEGEKETKSATFKQTQYKMQNKKDSTGSQLAAIQKQKAELQGRLAGLRKDRVKILAAERAKAETLARECAERGRSLDAEVEAIRAESAPEIQQLQARIHELGRARDLRISQTRTANRQQSVSSSPAAAPRQVAVASLQQPPASPTAVQEPAPEPDAQNSDNLEEVLASLLSATSEIVAGKGGNGKKK